MSERENLEHESRKQELLKQTLFYKGEEDYDGAIYVKDGQSCGYWDYERVWVRWELEQDDEYLRIVQSFRNNILKEEPACEGIPVGLQAIFASRISYWSGGREPVTMDTVREFCDRYKRTYEENKAKVEGGL